MMSTVHAMTVVAKRFYRVYVDDKQGTMSTEEMKRAAIKNFLEDPDEYAIIHDLSVEEQDVAGVGYDYSFDEDDDEDDEEGTMVVDWLESNEWELTEDGEVCVYDDHGKMASRFGHMFADKFDDECDLDYHIYIDKRDDGIISEVSVHDTETGCGYNEFVDLPYEESEAIIATLKAEGVWDSMVNYGESEQEE